MNRRIPAKAIFLRLFRRIIPWVFALSIGASVTVGALAFRITLSSPAAELVTAETLLLSSENLTWVSKRTIFPAGIRAGQTINAERSRPSTGDRPVGSGGLQQTCREGKTGDGSVPE